MNDLQEGQVLQDRFVLQRALRRTSVSHLWFARDRQLDAPLLLRVYLETALVDGDVREAIKRDALRHRRLHHPHAARICDVHEAADLLLVSIVPPEGDLLSAVLARTGPMPYRDVVAALRPLVDALAHVHENGGEHGRVDLEHVLVDAESRWILLPADGTEPDHADMTRLGQLLSALLTGGREPEGGRELNDMAERLHGGRTVPALMNQLVSDLGMDDASMRPRGMPDVLSRLDQIEAFVAPAEAVAVAHAHTGTHADAHTGTHAHANTGTGTHAGTAARAGTAAPAHKHPARHLVWLLVPIVLAAGGLALRGRLQQDPPPPPIVDAAPDPIAPGAADTALEEAAAEEARLAAFKPAADDALNRYLAVRQTADEVGTAAWGGEPYAKAVAPAGVADTAYLARDYEKAAARYDEAAQALQIVVDTKDDVLRQRLADGTRAIEAGDAAAATGAFRNVLRIDPSHAFAAIGLERASTLDELTRLLAAGRAHEENGRLALAHADFAAAAELDPRSQEAAAAYERIKDALAASEFRTLMARGLEAFHRGDYDEAQERLLEAQVMESDDTEVAEALVMVAEARLGEEVRRLRARALDHEEREEWQRARHAYRQVLAIDAAVQFAQDGKTRCETMIRLNQHASHFLESPDLLITPGPREDAERLVAELAGVETKGPKLERMYFELVEKVRLANTPLRVVLRSDEQTSVDVYKIGRYGTFEAKELELLPGVYTVVGHRRGYKDVRLTLRLEPGAQGTTLEVVCTEAI